MITPEMKRAFTLTTAATTYSAKDREAERKFSEEYARIYKQSVLRVLITYCLAIFGALMLGIFAGLSY